MVLKLFLICIFVNWNIYHQILKCQIKLHLKGKYLQIVILISRKLFGNNSCSARSEKKSKKGLVSKNQPPSLSLQEMYSLFVPYAKKVGGGWVGVLSLLFGNVQHWCDQSLIFLSFFLGRFHMNMWNCQAIFVWKYFFSQIIIFSRS